MRLLALLVIVVFADTVRCEDPPTTQSTIAIYVKGCTQKLLTFGQNTTDFVMKYNEQLPPLSTVREFVVKEELSDFVSSIIKQLRQRVADIANRLGFPIKKAVSEYYYQTLEPFVIDELNCTISLINQVVNKIILN